MDCNHLPTATSTPFHDALARGLQHWKVTPESVVLLRNGVNHVYGAVTRDGAPVIVRVSDGSKRERGELLGELLWLDHLIAEGCTVSTPIRSGTGALLETIPLDDEVYHLCCFERFGGRELRPEADPAWNDALLLRLGRQIGRIHRASDTLTLPAAQDRRQWYESGMMAFPEPLPPCYDRTVAQAMATFVKRMRSRSRPPRQYGLVHRDLHAGNLLVKGDRIAIIDFDLGCYAWRTIDFAVLLFVHYFYPSLAVPDSTPRLAAKVLGTLAGGYREEYPLDDEQLTMVGDLIKLHEVLNYVVMAPASTHWQLAMGQPHPTVNHSLRWIEALWREGRDLQLEPPG